MAAIQAVKDEVADMLSEIRNILKANKRSRSRERILRSEEITLETGESSITNGNHNHSFEL